MDDVKVVVFGNLQDVSAELALWGIKVTTDPDEAAAAVSHPDYVRWVPREMPVVVVGTGTIADLAVKKHRPDAVIAGREDICKKVSDILRQLSASSS